MTDCDYDQSHPETFLDLIALDVVNDPMYDLNGFNNRHHEYYMELILRTNFLPHYSTIRERFWHIANKTSQKPTCVRELCEESTGWHKDRKGHNDFCSNKCAKLHEWSIKRSNLEKSSN